MKKYINIAFYYAIASLLSGVIYRELTKAFNFTGQSALSAAHLHLFALGTLMFLLVAIFVQITPVSQFKSFKLFVILYNIGLPFMVAMFYVRGIFQIMGTELSRGLDASIAGMAGLSHITLSVAIILLFVALRKSQA